VALTSGEEVGDESGAAWLLRLHKELVNAEYVFNFDAGGPAIDQDVLRWIELQGSEKVYWTVTFTVKNAGGHSSLPRPDNAILRLATALKRSKPIPFRFISPISRGPSLRRESLSSKPQRECDP